MDRVRLGVLHLDLHPIDLEDCAIALGDTEAGWIPITLGFINSGLLDSFTPSAELVSLLNTLLADPGIGFEAECRPSDSRLVVRCSLIPSDGRGADWRNRPKRDRGRALKKLFQHLRSGWYGGGDFLLARGEEETSKINQLYSKIPSPCASTVDDWTPLSLGDHEAQSRIIRGDDLRGVKTVLYKYQLRSVNRMIQMEMEPKQLIDARYTKFRQSGRGRRSFYYVNLANYDIQIHVGRYDLPRGGILCEQMGVGKTLICLALILSTLHQTSQIPPHEVDVSPVVTDHMLHTYPFGPAQELRSRLPPIPLGLALPTLSELCANILAVRDRSSASDFSSHISALLTQKSSYYKYPPDTSCMRRAKAASISEVPERVYLSKTTLVVVPPILVDQWMQEIEKHTEGVLKVLRVEGELPGVARLLDYDIILMDVHRFGREDTLTRARAELGPSNLLGVRWKRIILDEGHVAGMTTTNAMRFAQMLSTERRWAVTGTPTKHLQQGGEMEITTEASRDKANMEDAVDSAMTLDFGIKGWSNRDIDDAARLGVIISGYLGAEPFRTDASFHEVITSHLKRHRIPFGAVGRLKYLMDSMMVKHRPDEIDTEASLPPTFVETVILSFEPMQRLSYNFLAALVVANVYACDFEDPDYFLHPRNQKSFQQVIRNLHIACLWFSAPQPDARGNLQRLENDIATKSGLSEEGKTIMREAAGHLQRAIDAPGWAEWMQYGVSLPLQVPSLPAELKTAWSESMGKDIDWVDVHSMMTIRDKNDNGITIHNIVDAGDRSLNRKKEESAAEYDKAAAAAERRKIQLEKKGLTVAQSDAAQKSHTVSPRKKGPTKKDRLDEALAQAARNAQLVIDVEARAHLPRPLDTTILAKTRSHKMNYLVKTIRCGANNDKFIIFGDSAELGHCTEVLDFFDISSVYAGGAVSAKERAEALDKFQHTDVKACLLDVKVAARGLNLVVANRMILLAPLWNLDTQAQAIKRIHRIGQTRPTKVEILVTQDTFEEDIAKRSSTSRTENEEKLYTRALIEHPRFVYIEHESEERFNARMAPFTSTDVGPSTVPSPMTPTPQLITPSSGDMIRVSIKEDSPSPDRRGLAKRHAEQADSEVKAVLSEIEKPKKRARVAFA